MHRYIGNRSVPATVTVTCMKDECEKTLTYGNHRWDKIRGESGWFLQRTGENWCPDHHPEWVTEWRARKKEAR